MADFTVQLTTDQVSSFGYDGFLRVERITTDDELASFRDVYDEMMRVPYSEYELTSEFGTGVLKEAWASQFTHPDLYESTFVSSGRTIAAALLDEDPDELIVIGQLLYKPPGSDRTIRWHQDEALWSSGPDYTGVAVWMALDPVTVETGCMQFVPGSHRRIEKHVTDDSDPKGNLRYIADLGGRTPVACPLPAGGATVHHFRTIHATGPNTTTSPRRAIVNRFYGGRDKHVFEAAARGIAARI